MKLGLVSDTHGLFDPALNSVLSGVHHILHAGDICGESVLAQLRSIAPVTAIRGNCYMKLETAGYPDWVLRAFVGWRFLMVHDLGKPERPHPQVQKLIETKKPHFVISGHSHQGRIQQVGSPFFINPGSCGKKRFKLERSVAILDLLREEIALISLESFEVLQTVPFGRSSDPAHSFANQSLLG